MALPTRVEQSPPNVAYTQLFAYDGSNQLEYVGYAKAQQPEHTYSIALGNLTNIVDSSNTATVTATAHGLTSGARVWVTGCSDADMNTAEGYIVTVTGADTFTFTSASVTDATYTDATLAITTRAPRSGAACWAIQRLVYSSSLQTVSAWAEGTSAETHAWGSRTGYAYY